MAQEVTSIITGTCIIYYFQYGEEGDSNSAVVVVDPHHGLLCTMLEGSQWSHWWNDPVAWGYPTFAEFLCNRSSKWITHKLLGNRAFILDEVKTYRSFCTNDPEVEAATKDFFGMLHQLGIIACHLECGATRRLQEEFGDNLEDLVHFKLSPPARALQEVVIPSLQLAMSTPDPGLQLC